MTSRTTKWRKQQRLKEKMCIIVANQQLMKSTELSSNSPQLSMEIDISSQNIDLDKFSTSTFTSQYSSSIDSVHKDHKHNIDDESVWLDIIDDDIDISNKIDISYDFRATNDDVDEFFNNLNEPTLPTEKELAAAMIILKTRHRLSIKCIDHICAMMRLSTASQCPASFESIKRLIIPNPSSNLTINDFFICSTCSSTSNSSNHCPNPDCKDLKTFTQQPFECMTMSIESQLRDILQRETMLLLHSQKERDQPRINEKIRDIHDGDIYRKILANENDTFLSLTMNIDGIQVSKSSSKSLWIITFAINEIRRRERFKMKNIIVGGIISSNVKPSHKQIDAFLRPIVAELVKLEKGRFYEIKRSTISELIFLKIYLICCCADKPAQSLMQGISEPTGAYGCGRCELQGITIAIKNDSHQKIRVFPLLSADQIQPRLRTNETYDEFINIDQNERAKTKNDLRDQMRGQIARCALRDLTYFDVGSCFASDSLHNIYHGVMRRLMNLWFEKKNRSQSWSLLSKMSAIDRYLSSIKYPSTSIRVPRSIKQYSQYKGSEIRSICLFGFPSICLALSLKYARHFLMLVVAVHLSESRSIDRNQIDDIGFLFDQFLHEFPNLYTVRQNTQVVHSLQHISASVRDFGSLGNYSTFNFENILGLITSTVHSTRRHAQEIRNNLNLLRAACIEVMNPKFHSILGEFANKLQSGKRVLTSSFEKTDGQVKFRYEDINSKDATVIQTALSQKVKLYRTCYFATIRFTTVTHRKDAQLSDSCVLFLLAGEPAVGFITNIIETDTKQLLFRIHPVSIQDKLYIRTKNRRITCSNVLYGNLSQDNNFVYVKPQSIVEKLVHVFDKRRCCHVFFRVPNLCESS